MRTTQKFFILSAAVSMALAGCGQSKSSAYNPYGQQTYNPWVNGNGQPIQVQQIQNCSQSMTQLTDMFGQRKCYAAPLATACPQAGGVLVNQGLCRIEREIRGASFSQVYVYIGAFAVNVPMNLSMLQPGESVKVIGNVKPRNSENPWAVELYQNNIVADTAKSGGIVMEEGANVVLTANSAAIAQMSQQGQVVNGQVVNGQVVGQNTGCVAGTVGCNSTMNTWNPITQMNSYGLRIYGRGTVHVQLKARAIGCEDGKGNRYPCQ